jgi:hypothetical protein
LWWDSLDRSQAVTGPLLNVTLDIYPFPEEGIRTLGLTDHLSVLG